MKCLLFCFVLDSSLFGFCETDLQGASQSSGMFLLKFEFIAYLHLFTTCPEGSLERFSLKK